MNYSEDNLRKILKEASLRVTNPRLIIGKILHEKRNEFWSVDDIFDLISSKKDTSCDHVTVYRTINSFEKKGLIKKSIFNGEATRYQWNGDEEKTTKRHNHFFKCSKCLAVEPIKGCAFHQYEKDLENKGYQNLSHHFEITGLCPKCVSKK